MPEMYGTHHSKMLVLFRHDDTAQVIIHTANMIPFDWTNMTQALWKSPLLPKVTSNSKPPTSDEVGSGARFKMDLLNYLRAYDIKRPICKPLVEELSKYDFSEIRAALVASVPGRQEMETEPETTSWGWPGLKSTLESVPGSGNAPEIVIQISSIATLGGTWLEKTFFHALKANSGNISNPDFRIIFPTADEVRRSLNGYLSGKAIHTKIQSATQKTQVKLLQPLLYHWASEGPQQSGNSGPVLDAGRKLAAPHIKTYIRFADCKKDSIDWMLVTSANLSKQAWGEATGKGGHVRICSYEIGVMIWPQLYGKNAKMVPSFKSDTPSQVCSR
jgi:tyrosyl-DNA phosphodiesterase-1